MQIIERHKREWNFQHLAIDKIVGDAYIIERSNLTRKGDWEYHCWIESWKPVEKEVDIDGIKTTLQLLEHKLTYEDNHQTDEEVEYVSIDAIPMIQKALMYARFEGERAYEKKGEKNAYSHIAGIRKMEDWPLVKWLSLAKRTIG